MSSGNLRAGRGSRVPAAEQVAPGDRPQRMRQGPVTLLEVAAAAGVSKSSASRFLDERLPQSDSETARRVRQVAAKLGYVRDVSAASLRRGKTMTIGVVVPRLTDTVMAMFYEAVAQACRRSGQFAVVATSDDEPDGDHAAVEALLHRRVDGLVISTARAGDDFFEGLAARGGPCGRQGGARIVGRARCPVCPAGDQAAASPSSSST